MGPEAARAQVLERWLGNRPAMDARLFDGTLDSLIADLLLPGGGYAQDPLASAPEVVAEAAKTLGLEPDSARYWLQLLTLANPTDKLIDTWNGWTKAKRTRAVQPLLDAGLVMEAKRARAGRNYFLPGGWLEASAPHLPIEAWKSPFFALRAAQKVDPVYSVVAASVPYGALFADAWARYNSGDVPGYDELQTQRARRR